MAEHGSDSERRLRSKNRWKAIRTVLQAALLVVVVALAARAILFPNQYTPVTQDPAYLNASETEWTQNQDGEEQTQAGSAGRSGFIAISYNGLTRSDSLDSAIVTQEAFEEQMAALHASGYVTITQQDVLDYYLYQSALPEKAVVGKIQLHCHGLHVCSEPERCQQQIHHHGQHERAAGKLLLGAGVKRIPPFLHQYF